MKILIIGFGNMGRTYAKGFLSSRFISPDDLYILDKVSKHSEATGIDIPMIRYTISQATISLRPTSSSSRSSRRIFHHSH